MHDSPLEIELLARQRIREYAGPHPRSPRTRPHPRRRTRLADGLRRVADRLDA